MPDAPDVPRIAATLQAFLEGAEALRAVALVDRGDGAEPLVVDCLLDGSVEVADGEDVREVPGPEWLDAAPLAALPELRAFGALDVDFTAGTITAPLGVLDRVGMQVRNTAALLPGRSVLTAGFETTDPERPLFLTARQGEPMVATLGEEEYRLPEGWP